MKYQKLFDFVAKRLETNTCDHTHRFVEEFAKKHKLCFDKISKHVSEFGGYCDCEILFNVAGRIDEDSMEHPVILTPKEFCHKYDLWCNCTVNGVPVASEDAIGKPQSKMWVKCNKDDPFAVEDLNTAAVLMSR